MGHISLTHNLAREKVHKEMKMKPRTMKGTYISGKRMSPVSGGHWKNVGPMRASHTSNEEFLRRPLAGLGMHVIWCVMCAWFDLFQLGPRVEKLSILWLMGFAWKMVICQQNGIRMWPNNEFWEGPYLDIAIIGIATADDVSLDRNDGVLGWKLDTCPVFWQTQRTVH